jgi:thiamine-phosphate pyrophosphorylase
MILCLVTDRRRLGAAIGARPSELLDILHEQVAAAAEVGIDLVQIREPDLDARVLTDLVRSLIARCRGSATRILVNDRLDVAIAAGAAGVHLKESSITPELARGLMSTSARATVDKPHLVTCAVHTPLTATARHSADLLIAGTVLPTVSKSPTDYLEWKGLQKVIGAAKGTPVLGIGGLDLRTIPLLAASGAAGLAAIGAFIPPPGNGELKEFVKKRVTDMRFAFDSAPTDP